MILSAVVVVDKNWGIGKNNKLLVHFPADLKRFKNITTGHSIIMGRKTFESMGRPLPNRRNIVITRQTTLSMPGAEIANSLEHALKLCKNEPEVFVIGGAEIFNQAFAMLNKVYLTEIKESFEADTFFPEIRSDEWKETEREDFLPDEKTPFSYSFLTYKKL